MAASCEWRAQSAALTDRSPSLSQLTVPSPPLPCACRISCRSPATTSTLPSCKPVSQPCCHPAHTHAALAACRPCNKQERRRRRGRIPFAEVTSHYLGHQLRTESSHPGTPTMGSQDCMTQVTKLCRHWAELFSWVSATRQLAGSSI